jgi:hypothetical protein
MGEGNENLFCPSVWDFKSSLTCRKILLHGNSGFTSHPKEGVLRIFIALKNASPWLGSNPQPLGPVASTLHHQGDTEWRLKYVSQIRFETHLKVTGI